MTSLVAGENSFSSKDQRIYGSNLDSFPKWSLTDFFGLQELGQASLSF